MSDAERQPEGVAVHASADTVVDDQRPATPIPPAEVERLVERLSRHRTLAPAPRDELVWLATHGQLKNFEPAALVSTPSADVAGMYIVLSGRLSIFQVREGIRHKMAEWGGGDVTGLLPYSRMTRPPGETVVEEATETLMVRRDDLPDLARHCYGVTGILVHVMLDRARFFTSAFLHDEKLKSLGKLAAGLAHELNNPAAAIRRFAGVLPGSVEEAESSARELGGIALTPAESEAVRQASAACADQPIKQVLSPLQEAEREEAVAGWLEAHGLDDARLEALSQSPLTLAALDRVAAAVRPEVLAPALRWVAADASVRGLAREIGHAAQRISDLVTAVRGFTRVDTSASPGPVDLAEALGQTLAVLRGKARGKSVGMTIEIENGLPQIRGVAAELNQVWANLVDNAIDAAPTGGTVEVTVRREGTAVVVRVADNGPGIPPEVRDRIFDPFFTTKDVGKGTGLGLDIVRRLVDRHNGDIQVQSRPGHTEFSVSLPVETGLSSVGTRP